MIKLLYKPFGLLLSALTAAAAVEGAVVGGTKAVVDRAGAKACAKATGTWPR
jgi:hypothetical protein